MHVQGSSCPGLGHPRLLTCILSVARGRVDARGEHGGDLLLHAIAHHGEDPLHQGIQLLLEEQGGVTGQHLFNRARKEAAISAGRQAAMLSSQRVGMVAGHAHQWEQGVGEGSLRKEKEAVAAIL
jgi:hypothetical protein